MGCLQRRHSHIVCICLTFLHCACSRDVSLSTAGELLLVVRSSKLAATGSHSTPAALYTLQMENWIQIHKYKIAEIYKYKNTLSLTQPQLLSRLSRLFRWEIGNKYKKSSGAQALTHC